MSCHLHAPALMYIKVLFVALVSTSDAHAAGPPDMLMLWDVGNKPGRPYGVRPSMASERCCTYCLHTSASCSQRATCERPPSSGSWRSGAMAFARTTLQTSLGRSKFPSCKPCCSQSCPCSPAPDSNILSRLV
jgi:hypothetical protein